MLNPFFRSLFFFLPVYLLILGLSAVSKAEDTKTTSGPSQIIILFPKPGEVLPAGEEVMMSYQLIRGLRDNGDHIHVYIDGENDGTSKRSPRSLGKLRPGKHTVILKVANQNHDSVKVEATVQFEISSQINH
jgi:hypothetical protein